MLSQLTEEWTINMVPRRAPHVPCLDAVVNLVECQRELNPMGANRPFNLGTKLLDTRRSDINRVTSDNTLWAGIYSMSA